VKMAKLSKYIEAAKTSKYNKMAEEFVKAGHKVNANQYQEDCDD